MDGKEDVPNTAQPCESCTHTHTHTGHCLQQLKIHQKPKHGNSCPENRHTVFPAQSLPPFTAQCLFCWHNFQFFTTICTAVPGSLQPCRAALWAPLTLGNEEIPSRTELSQLPPAHRPGKSIPRDTNLAWGSEMAFEQGKWVKSVIGILESVTPKAALGLAKAQGHWEGSPIPRDSAASPLHSDIPAALSYSRLCSQPLNHKTSKKIKIN